MNLISFIVLIFYSLNLYSNKCNKLIIDVTAAIYFEQYKHMSTSSLEKYINNFIKNENKKRDYIVGLSEKYTINNLEDLKGNLESLTAVVRNIENPVRGFAELYIDGLANKKLLDQYLTIYLNRLEIYAAFKTLFLERYKLQYVD